MAENNTKPDPNVPWVNIIRNAFDTVWKFFTDYAGRILIVVFLIVLATIVWRFGSLIVEAPLDFLGKIIFVTSAIALPLLILSFLIVFSGRKVDETKLDRIIVYCYVFTWFSLVASVLTFVVLPIGGELPILMRNSPIGILKGCSQVPIHGKASVPEELQCDKNTDQWLVNVGGKVVPNDEDREPWAPVRIEGGLIVPLYFVILALVGAAVSMTRRVPEYQERTAPGSAQPLSNEKAREYLVLQVMQVVSAPLIAVTAYYLIDPGSRAGTVALGFVSGFASETILLYIRAVVDKLQPKGALQPSEPNIEVAPSSLDSGDQALNTTSASQTITVTNKTDKPLNVDLIEVTGPFTQGSKCPATIAAGTMWSIDVKFVPNKEGICKGVLTIVDDGAGSPRSVLLTGNGV